MAPKGTKGTKRTAAVAHVEVELPEAKKLKETLKAYGVSKTSYDAVVEALQHPLIDVSDSARDMLIASVLKGICVPVNQRHEFQNSYVEMLAQTLQGVLSQLKMKVETGTEEVSRIEAAKTELQAQVSASDEALQKALETESKGKEDFAEATGAARAAQTKLSELEKLRSEGDAAHDAAKKEKAQIEAALTEEFRVLRDGTDGDEAKAHYKKLEQVAKSSGMENSLLRVLPNSILKPPSKRGSFEAMVVVKLEEGLTKRCTALAEQIQQGEPAAAERQAAVEGAMKELEAAKVHEEKTAEMYRETQTALKACQDAKKEADQKVEEAEPTLQSAKKVLQEASVELENYQNYNWTCFEDLKDHRLTEPEAAASEASEAKDVATAEPLTEAAVATAGA